MNKAAKRYLDEVSSRMGCTEKNNNGCLEELSGLIEEYCSERPDASVEDLYREFGNPSDYTEAFFDGKNRSETLMKERRKVRNLFLICATVALAVAFSCFIIYVILRYGGRGYIEVSDIHVAGIIFKQPAGTVSYF